MVQLLTPLMHNICSVDAVMPFNIQFMQIEIKF